MRGIIAEVSVAEDKEAAFYQALIRLSNEEVDVSGMLDQYGALGVQLLSGAKSADELYAALIRLENLNGLQVDLENADALTQAAKVIDPAQSGYDPLSALASYDLLEAKFAELMELQRGSAEYIQRARELTDEGTAAVYRQAAAYGVVTDLQAKSAQAAAASQTERTFRHADENAYEGGASYLAKAMREAAAAGEDVKLAWSRALSNLDEAGVLEGMSALFGDISMLAVECGGNVEAIIRRLYEMRDAAQSISLSDVAEELRREREGNIAGTEGYRSQVDELFSAFDDGGMEGVSRAMEVWSSFDESIQQSIAETYPSLVIALDEANRAASALSEGIGDLENAEGGLSDSSKATEKKIEALGKELDVAQKNASARYFKNTTRAIEDLKHGTISAADAFGDYNAEAEKAVEANEEYQKASKKMAAGTKVTVDEIDTLAQFLGNIDPSILLANWDQVGPMISSALAEGEAAFDRLNEAAFVTITGTSVADFSALTAGLISVQNLAADAVDALIATGQWTIETITLPQEGAQWDPIAGVWTRTRMNTNQNVLRYNGNNPLRSGSGKSASSSSGGSGKGGGGSSSTSVSKSIEKMLDKMDATVDIEDHRRKMAQLGQNYHETRGEIQGVLKYMELEKQIIQENSATLEGYVSSLEAQIESQKAILATNKESSSKYKQAMVDLAALQEQHKQYSQTLVQNKIDLEELEKAMKEQQDAIRQMEIDLRDLIHDAILDREDLIKRMLDGQIDLENELIDVLTQRYEKERDEILKLAETKRDALSEELELLDRQLEARRQLNEQQDRAKQLAEKEAQLARISADPTRKKEELALREEIAKLREEIAWELAEEEVDAQKKSIESQMESIDDYMEYVQTYYEELLSNPRRLIEEMQALLTQTDEEILLWLTQNHEDYQAATDATREQMRREWQEMLDDMRGNTKTYWDEVEAIIAQGDQAIIDFLKDNSADYREAGKLQAQAYADEWQKQLDALKAAYKQVSAEIQSYDYTPTTKSSSSSSSSSGSSSSSKKTTTSRFVSSGTGYAEAYIKTATSISYNGSTYVKDPHSNYWYKTSDAKRIDGGRTYYWKTGTTRYVKKYAEGGMAKSTGLAWLDGTEQQPERILSPYQTELFEDMLKTLHAIRTFQAPASVVQPKLPEKASQQGLYIDSITVQVQRLDSDQDYEEMAERVGEHIMERVSRGMAVGGIRIG